VEMALYRVAQEALTNVLKHARARHVRLKLGLHLEESDRGVVSLIVEDDGAGFTPAQDEGTERGFGLKGMRERIALLCGRLDVSFGDEGTTLTVTVPVSTPHGKEGDGNVTHTDRG
jgi:signal transduction histidine kinase